MTNEKMIQAKDLREDLRVTNSARERSPRIRNNFYGFLATLLIVSGSVSADNNRLPAVADLVDKVGDTVVNITASYGAEEETYPEANPAPNSPEDFFRRFFPNSPQFQPRSPNQAPKGEGYGSGFIVSSDGYILTNYHVIKDATEVLVRTKQKKEYKAEIVGLDSTTDLALLKIDDHGLPFTILGDSQSLRIGDWVVAIGSPFGFTNSVTVGVVSAKGRGLSNDEIGRYVPFLQTDVAINPGNSGGPLFDLNGNVVGVNSQIFTRSGGWMGLSFSIPVEVVKSVYRQLRKDGKVRRGWLGVSVQPITSDLAEALRLDTAAGALVSGVLPDSPAEKSGLRSGDVILKVDEVKIEEFSELPPAVGLKEPGSIILLEVYRDGKIITLDAELISLKEGEIQGGRATAINRTNPLKIEIEEIPENERKRLNIRDGVKVKKVFRGPASKAGVQSGDILRALNGYSVSDITSFDKIVNELPTERPVWVSFLRGNSTRIVTMKLSN